MFIKEKWGKKWGLTVYKCNSQWVCGHRNCETRNRKCLWTCFSAYYSGSVWLMCVCSLFLYESSMYTLFCMCMLSCQHAFVFVFMCVFASLMRVCVCACVHVQAGSRAPLGDGLIQQGSTSKRLTAARAAASLTLTWLLSHRGGVGGGRMKKGK